MYLKDSLTLIHIGRIDHYAPVKTTGTEQCRIKDIDTVRGSDDYDVRINIESVHLHEDLIERLLTFILSAA